MFGWVEALLFLPVLIRKVLGKKGSSGEDLGESRELCGCGGNG